MPRMLDVDEWSRGWAWVGANGDGGDFKYRAAEGVLPVDERGRYKMLLAMQAMQCEYEAWDAIKQVQECRLCATV